MPDPVETLQAYGQTLKRFDTSGSYGTEWTCNCPEFTGGDRCWHIIATVAKPHMWPPRVRTAVEGYRKTSGEVL